MTLSRKVQFTIQFILIALSLVWLYEARTCGFCWFSSHIAPVVIIGNLVMPIYVMYSAATANKRKT